MANIFGTPVDDILNGTAGNDFLYGDAGDDALYGFGGDDTLNGGPGADLLDGGANGPFLDMADYSDSPYGVGVDLSTGTAVDGWGYTDTLVGIEGVIGSAYNDVLIGDSNQNWFTPGTGDDGIYAGGGFDVVFYEYGTPGAVIVNLDQEYAYKLDGFGNVIGTDILVNVEAAHGSYFDDVITLTNGDSYAFGRAGNDQLFGLDGNDTLIGGSGNDYLDGGNGDFDQASFYDPGNASGVTVHLGAVSTVTDNWGDTDTLVSIERVQGSSGDDVFSADGGLNAEFGAFNEFEGMAGNDIISGNGETRITYNQSPNGIIANLSATSFTFGDPGTTTVAANSVLDGWGTIDTIGAGVYSIRTNNNDDYVLGSAGDDEFRVRGGDDWVDGGAGSDTIRYSSNSSVYVDLSAGLAVNDGFGGTDTLINIENVRAGNGADTLIGDAGDNRLRGEGGNDNLSGGGGNDRLEGGGGSDTLAGGDGDDDLFGGGGNDSLDGGAGVNFMMGGSGDDNIVGGTGTGDEIFMGGNGEGGFDYDIASFQDASGGIVATLDTVATVTGAGVGTDTLTNVEEVRGSAFDDVFTATVNFTSSYNAINAFQGRGGDDVINGNGSTVLRYNDAAAAVTVDMELGIAYGSDGLDTANVGTDTFTGVNWVRGSNFDDTILGSSGDDIIRGEAGNDYLDGGAGIDRVDFNSYANGVTVDLAGGTAIDGLGGTDTLLNFENVRGSRLDDNIAGDSGANALSGNGGDDILDGRTGDDTVEGNGGNDTIIDGGAVVEIVPGSGGGGECDDDEGHGGHGHGKGRGHDHHGNGKGKGHDKHHDDDHGGKAKGHDHHGNGKGKGHDDHGNGKGKGHDKHHDDCDDDGGNTGDTIVVIESDNDIYAGGTGDDLFVFGEYNGHDTITDFAAGAGSDDVIDVTALNLGSLADLLALADDNGGTTDTTITFSDEGSITLVGVQVADLHQDDFLI